MTLFRVRRGRPLAEPARQVLSQIQSSPMTVPQLARSLKLSVRMAETTVWSLVRGGYVQYGAPTPGSHLRPARLVEPRSVATPEDGLRALHEALTARIR